MRVWCPMCGGSGKDTRPEAGQMTAPPPCPGCGGSGWQEDFRYLAPFPGPPSIPEPAPPPTYPWGDPIFYGPPRVRTE